MQPTTGFHDGIANPVRQEAYLVFHHPIALHPTDRVFNTDSDGRDRAIARLLRWREFSTRGFFLGLKDRHPIACILLEAHILIETTPGWESIALQLSQAFIIRLPFIGGTQEANVTGRINHDKVSDRVALLLATVVFLLFLWIGWAVDRLLSAIMPKRGPQARPSSVRPRAARLNRRPCELEGALGVLMSDSTRHGGDESTYWCSIGTSQRVVPALLGWDSVLNTPE
jgi:hypothetical protein